MGGLLAVMTPLRLVNELLLTIGRWIGAFAVAMMVVAILIQVFYRYVLGNPLAWPDEAARFAMLWMTGLMAPTAFRRGGFVALDVVTNYLGGTVLRVLGLILLILSLVVLLTGLQIGWKEVTGFGGRFATASLYVPLSLGFDEWYRVPRSWMMASILVGFFLLVLVNIELILRSIVQIMGGGDRLPEIDDGEVALTE